MARRKKRKKTDPKMIENKTVETKEEKPLTKEDILALFNRMQNIPSQTAANPPQARDPAAAIPQQPPIIQTPIEAPIQAPQQYPPQPQIPQIKLTPAQEKRIIAQEMLKLHKNIIILSIMFFILPFIAVFTAIINPTYAMIVILCGIIYPAFSFVKSTKMQDYLSIKYQLKPFTLIKKQPKRRDRGIDIF